MPNACKHIEDASIKSLHYKINKWFGSAEHDVSGDSVVDRHHGLRAQRLGRAAYQCGTPSRIDARFLRSCVPSSTDIKSLPKNHIVLYDVRSIRIVDLCSQVRDVQPT